MPHVVFFFIKSSPRAKRNNRKRDEAGDSVYAYKRNKIK